MYQSPIAEMKESKENEELKGNFEYDQNPIHLPRQDTGKTPERLVLSRNLTRGVGIYTGFTQSDSAGEPPSGADENGVGNDLFDGRKEYEMRAPCDLQGVFEFVIKMSD